jgi:iron(III) transport system permease protein
MLLAAPIAFLTGRTDVLARGWLSAMALVPLAFPPYNTALSIEPFVPRGSIVATSLVLALALYPVAFLFLRAGFMSVDPSLDEAAVIARGTWPAVRAITWPLLRPWAAAAFGVVLLLGVGEFGAPALLGLTVYPAWIALRFAATYDAAGAALQALPIFAAVVLVLAAEKVLVARAEPFAGRLREPFRIALGPRRRAATVLCVGIVLASPGLPLIATVAEIDRAGFASALPLALGPARNSLLVAGGGSLLALGFGIAMALHARAGSRGLGALPLALFVLPGAILGVALIGFWNRPGMPPLYGTPLLLILGVALRYTVLTARSLDAGLRSIPRAQEDVARLAGRSSISTASGILLPQLRIALAAGAAAFLLFAIRDLDTVVTIYPPGGETLTVRLYAILANAPRGLKAALSLAQFCLALPVLVLLAGALRRSRWVG